jgi:Tol biopolymer transport system component
VVATVVWHSGLREAVFVVSPTSSRRIRIGFDALSELPQPVWSPDGDRFAFVRAGSSRGGDIYVASADGRLLQRLTHSARALEPVWSPDGKQLAFTQRFGFRVGDSNGVPEVYVSNVSGGLRRLTHTRALPPPKNAIRGSYTPPGSHAGAWSPDGRWLAVVTNGALAVVPAAGGPVRVVRRFKVPFDLIRLGPIAWPRP